MWMSTEGSGEPVRWHSLQYLWHFRWGLIRWKCNDAPGEFCWSQRSKRLCAATQSRKTRCSCCCRVKWTPSNQISAAAKALMCREGFNKAAIADVARALSESCDCVFTAATNFKRTFLDTQTDTHFSILSTEPVVIKTYWQATEQPSRPAPAVRELSQSFRKTHKLPGMI